MKLSCALLSFAQVGPLIEPKVITIPYQHAARQGPALVGSIPVIDFHYGNIWTNISDQLWAGLHPRFGQKFLVTIQHDGREVYRGTIPYARTFGDVPLGQPLLYLNSLLNVAFALDQGSFAEKYGLAAGGGWSARIVPAD